MTRLFLFGVVLSSLSFASVLAQSTDSAPAPAAPAGTSANPAGGKHDVVLMSPFSVSTNQDYGYRKMSSVTSSRTGELIQNMPQSIEVVSSELLSDFMANQGNDAFRYSSSVMVSENEVGQSDVMNLRGFSLPRYYNGVALANAYSLVPIDIWDNIDRIEIVKGPVGLYYANTTPNGVANFITKKPQFINATSVDVTYGSFDFQKVVIDQQVRVNDFLATRVIASENSHGAGYHNGSPTRYFFLSPSVVVRPFKTMEITAEVDYLNEHSGYQGGANSWAYSFNPAWQQDLANPSAAMLAYATSHYGAANNAAAQQAMLQAKWSPPNTSAGTALAKWSADLLNITGTAPFLYTTQSVDWAKYSPDGDRMAPQSPTSTYGGNSPTYEISVTETPLEGLSVRYHWVHAETNQQFIRQIIQPNTNGFRSNGQANSLDVSALALQGINDFGRDNSNDTQQIDVQFVKEAWGIKHQFGLGAEYLRSSAIIPSTPVDFTKAGSVTTPNGTVLTGIQVYQNWDPFSGQPLPSIFAVQSGPAVIAASTLSKDHQYYASYRGTLLDDRVHVLLGVNQFSVDPSGPKNTPIGNHATTYTYGLIGEIAPGLSLFASKSGSVQFTNQLSAIGVSVLPSDNAHVLNNEQDKGYEVGLKTTWHNNELAGTLSYYDDQRDGVVEADQLRNLTDPRNSNGTGVQFFVNGGLQVSRGIDADFTWTPNPQFQMVLNYDHSIEARIVSDPSVNPNTPGTLAYQREFLYPLSHSPKDRANLVGKYNFEQGALKNFSLGGALRYSATYMITNNQVYNLWVPTETFVDFFVAYHTRILGIPSELRLNVNNIGNVGRDDYTWGDGRTEYVSLGFHF